MKMKGTKVRVLVLGMSLLMMLSMFTGCGGDGGTTAPGEKVKVSFSTWAGAGEQQEIDDLLKKLNDASDIYEIEQKNIPNDYYMVIQTQIAGQQAPDLMWLSQEYIPVYADKGAIAELDSMMADQSDLDMGDFLPGPLAAAKYDEKLYGLPWIGQPYVVYYNKGLFEKNNVDLPTADWDWNKFYDTAKALTDGKVYGFATTGNPPLQVFQWGFGGETIDAGGNIQVSSPESVEGLKFAYDMVNDQKAVMPYNKASSINVEDAFMQEKIAMMVGGAADDIEKKVREAGDKFEVGMAIMPAGPKEHVTFSWTASTVMSAQVKNPDVVQKALVDLTKAIFDYKIPAPVKSKVDKVAEINPDKKYALDVIRESCNIARGFNNRPQQNELDTYFWENVVLPIYSNNDGKGNVNIESLVNGAKSEFEKIMSQ